MNLLFIIFLTLSIVGVNSLKCYQCSNIENSMCGDPFSANNTLQECPLLGGTQEAKMCRKLRQIVDTPLGKIIRITRSCGYISNEQEERDSNCFRASFTAGSSSKYCSCIDSACNNVDKINASSIITIIMLLASIYVFAAL